MPPSHYADPAGNPVAIPDLAALMALLRSNQIDGQTWVLTDAHEDWVPLASLPEWPDWLAAARPVRQAAPPPAPGIYWPAKVGAALLLLAPLLLFGIYYLSRGSIRGTNFGVELGGLALGAFLGIPTGHTVRTWVRRTRSPHLPPVHGIVVLTIGSCVLLGALGTGAHTWRLAREGGTRTLSIADAVSDTTNPHLVRWATERYDEEEAILAKLADAAAPAEVLTLETRLTERMTSAQTAQAGATQARSTADAYQRAAAALRRLITQTEQRLQALPLTADLRDRQQALWARRTAPAVGAVANFLAARSEAMTMRAELLTVATYLIQQCELSATRTGVTFRSSEAEAEYKKLSQRLATKQALVDTRRAIMTAQNPTLRLP